MRLFKELEARNQELTVSLAQQTATSEVLAVISGAQTEVQPVFEAIVQSARRLHDSDPVGLGLVASIARPGGNVTGSSFNVDVELGKALELLKETVPKVRRVAPCRSQKSKSRACDENIEGRGGVAGSAASTAGSAGAR